jgi:hypothetical protein
MARTTAQRWFDAAGIAVGLTVVVVAAAGWRIPAGNGLPGAAIEFSVAPTGDLAVEPAGTFIQAAELEPSDDAAGRFSITNQSGSTLAIRLRAQRDVYDLDAVVHVGVKAGATILFTGPLGRLGGWTDPFVLAPGESRRLSFRIWLPYPSGAEARQSSVGLEFETEPVDV